MSPTADVSIIRTRLAVLQAMNHCLEFSALLLVQVRKGRIGNRTQYNPTNHKCLVLTGPNLGGP